MGKVKLVISDVDNTLIDSTEQLSKVLIETIKKCKEKGIIFTLATGRSYELTKPIISSLDVFDPYITSNGASIMQGDFCLINYGFEISSIRNIIEEAHEMGLTVTLTDIYKERATRQTEYVKHHQRFGNRFEEYINLESIDWESQVFQKLMIYDGKHSSKIEGIRDRLRKYVDKYSITAYTDKAVELGPKNRNKAAGLYDLLTILNLSPRDVLACGDYINDYEMIKMAGIGVAVGNASPIIKEAADYTTKATYDLGVVEAIEKFCFNKN